MSKGAASENSYHRRGVWWPSTKRAFIRPNETRCIRLRSSTRRRSVTSGYRRRQGAHAMQVIMRTSTPRRLLRRGSHTLTKEGIGQAIRQCLVRMLVVRQPGRYPARTCLAGCAQGETAKSGMFQGPPTGMRQAARRQAALLQLGRPSRYKAHVGARSGSSGCRNLIGTALLWGSIPRRDRPLTSRSRGPERKTAPPSKLTVRT